MTPTSLNTLLHDRATPGGEVVRSSRGSWTAEQLQAVTDIESLAAAATHGSVALRLADPEKMILALVALDGQVDRLLLLSPDAQQDEASALLERFGADALLCDDSDGINPADATLIDWSEPVQRPLTDRKTQAGGHSRVATQWILATSGTTGNPKLVGHDLASLTRTTKAAKSGNAPRWGQLFSMSRFAGVQVLLQGLAGGVIILPEPEWDLSVQIDFLADQGCDALSATPTLWRKILMTPGHENLALKQITLGGEIADEGVLRSLARSYETARITHIYASTEAGAAFSVNDGKAGFPARFLEEPPKGINIRVADGRLFVQNPLVRPSYLNSAESFVGTDGFVDTGDMIDIVGDRCLFLGRANGFINVGGNKLLPEEVEQVLLSDDAVQLARVYPKKSPITGQLVIADVVLSQPGVEPEAVKAALKALCVERLTRWKVPAIIRIVDSLAISSGSKIDRKSN